MTFAEPYFLLALLLVPLAVAAYLLVQRRRSRYAVRFTNVDLVANLVPKSPGWRRHLPPVLYLVAIAALATALAKPSMAMQIPREEATIVLAIDVSGSMQATDVGPDRLTAAKTAATQFVDQLPSTFRVGLVAFSTRARVEVAPTTDRAQVRTAISGLTADGGTALGDAINLTLEAAGVGGPTTAVPTPGSSTPPGSPSPASPSPTPGPAVDSNGKPIVATVLLSDGANSTGALQPLDAAARAAAAGVPVYTIALGTPAGIVQVPDRQGMLHQLSVPPDPETLAAIAEMTGALFFQAPTASDLAQIYQNLGSRIGFTTETREVTTLFAAFGLVFILAGAGLAAHWFNRFP
jgi:Ca-activated chloride channel family protein